MKRIYALLALFAVSVSLGAPANKTLNIPIYETSATSFVGRTFTVSGNNSKVLGITGGDWALVSPLFGTSPTITTSILTDSTTFAVFNTTATTVNAFGAATTLNVGTSAATVLNFGGAATAAQFRFLEPSGSGTNYTGFKAQAQAGNVTYTLPAADGTNGQFLKTNGTGTLSWGTASGGGGGLTGSEGGNGAADSGLAALFDAAGSLTATTELTVKNASTAAHAYLADDGTIGFHAVGETNPRELVFPTDVLENEAKEIATKDWVTANAPTGTVRKQTVTDASPVTVTMTADTVDLVVLEGTGTGTITVAAPTGTVEDGKVIKLRIKSTSARTLTFNSVFRFSTDQPAPTATSSSSLTDYFSLTWNATDSKWDVLGKNFGF